MFVCLRAVCCSAMQGWLGFPWPLFHMRGWAKTCATVPWPRRGRLLRLLCFLPPCAAEPMRRERVSRLPQAPSGARPGLDAGATGALHCAALEGGRTTPQQLAALRSAARVVESARPARRRQASWGFAGGLASGAAAHSPASKRPIDLHCWSAGEPQSPLGEGDGGERKQWHGQSAAAPVPSSVRPLAGRTVRQGAASVRARCRADGGQERGLAAQQPAGAVQPWRRISGCTDRSAGGCADRRTFVDI